MWRSLMREMLSTARRLGISFHSLRYQQRSPVEWAVDESAFYKQASEP